MLLEGKKARDHYATILSKRIAGFSVPPTLCIIQVGKKEESTLYIEQKKKFGAKVGARVIHEQFPEDISEQRLLEIIAEKNSDDSIHGIIIQMPLPPHLSVENLCSAILPKKDVDGLGRVNMELLEKGLPTHVPATARGILSLLNFYNISVSGKKVVVVGRSRLVGKPTALLLKNLGAEVVVCHRGTGPLSQHTKSAVILVVAAGHPGLIGKNEVSQGQTVVDVGINTVIGEKLEEEIPKRKIVGDVSFDEVFPIVENISPVPGGVGPMTVLSLFENLADAFENL